MREQALIELAPSILAADFAHLAEEVEEALEGGATVAHCDVMDGHFVPNLSLGPCVLASLKKALGGRAPLDAHLMIDNPERYVEEFARAGADWISVHVEVLGDRLPEMLRRIRGLGCRAGAVLNPATRVEALSAALPEVDYVLVMSVEPGFGGQSFMPVALDKLRELAERRRKLGLQYRLQVDGGVRRDNVGAIVAAGAEILVAGSAVFRRGQTRRRAADMLEAARAAVVRR